MKSKMLYAAIVLLSLAGFISNAQPLPTGKRLKDIPAGPKIGTLISYGDNNPENTNGMFMGPDTTKRKALVSREFNVGATVVGPKYECWPDIPNIKAPFNFDNINTSINWTKSKGMTTMFQLLCGPDIYFPDWFTKGKWSKFQQDSILRNWIYAIMETNNNKNKVNVWCVVNEPLNDDGKFKDTSGAMEGRCKWYEMGLEPDASGLTGVNAPNASIPVYIRKAFEYAANKTDNILELRDYGFEFGPGKYYGDAKAKAFYQLVRHLINKGVKIGAIGFQCHFDLGKVDPVALKNQVKLYTDLGLQVNFTELDVAVADTLNPLSAQDAQQQRIDFKNVVNVAIESGVSIINTWNYTDGDIYWLTKNKATVFKENFEAKPSYYGIQEALQNAVYKYDTLSTGTYILKAKHSGKVLDIKSSATNNGATVWQYSSNGTTAQQWKIKHIQGGYHKVIAACSGKGLDIRNISCRDGALLQQYDFGNGENQLWKFEKLFNGFYKISARHSGKALDVVGAGTADGTLVQQNRFYFADNQLWSLQKLNNNNATKIVVDNTESKFQLYPNPARGISKLTCNNKGDREEGLLQITNAAGKIIQQKKIILQSGININSINTTGWVPGTYVIQLSAAVTKKQIIEKLIVQ
jgi:GH35 family endo-1,4-beta-xylanase